MMISRIKVLVYTFLAATLLTGLVACADSDDAIEQNTLDIPKTYTLTVEAGKGSDATRALSLGGADGKTLNATWTKGDSVQVYHVSNPGPSEVESTTPDGTLYAQSDGATTTLTGTFTGTYTPAAGDVLRLRFNDNPDYSNQEGTLDYIAKHCDYATAEITVESVDASGNVTPTTTAEFKNKQAIVKFSLKQPDDTTPDGTTPLAATSLKVKVGSTTYNVKPTTAASDIYVALPNVKDKNVTLTATDADADSYSYTKSGVTFTTSQYYAIGVKMTEEEQYTQTIILDNLIENFTVQDHVILTGTLKGGYKISIADGVTVKLKDVTIAGGNDDNKPWAGITCLGDATIRLSGTNSVKGCNRYYPGIQAGGAGTTLTIEGSGKLTATYGGIENNRFCAGIGGGLDQVVGNIVIAGGDITAIGGSGAGIGSGYAKQAAASCGTITISGGTVWASSNGGGAGIGSGNGSSSCGAITITGGTITATGSYGGAGIGSGNSLRGIGSSYCDDISITGGNITAKGGTFSFDSYKFGAAGIGTGREACCGSVTISGTATGTATHGANNLNTCYDIGTGYNGKLNDGCTISVAAGTISGSHPQ